MQVLLVLANPKAGSTTHQLGEAYADGLIESGCVIQTADLFAKQFNPVLTQQEIDGWSDGKYPEEVLEAQRLINHSQGMAFVFPIWWNAPPAILSGWLQRILTEGFAFRKQDGKHIRLLNQKVQLLISTGSTKTDATHIYTDPFANTFNYCGINDIEVQLHAGVYEGISEETLADMLDQAFTAGLRFARLLKSGQN